MPFSLETALVLTLVVPLLGMVAIWLLDKNPNLREAATITTGAVLFLIVVGIAGATAGGARPSLDLVQLLPGFYIRFAVEPLGAMFALIASGLWIVNSFYSIGYMRGAKEQNQTRFYMCFAVAIASALGIAFAGNILTLFIFYEVLTLSTFPLVTHKGTAAAAKGGRVYLGILMGTSIGFLLLAVIWTQVVADTGDFTPGGILAGKAEGAVLGALLLLFMFGIGKAALMPFHAWLPNAMVAPTPVSAFLHAVAVVKAGVFTVLKVAVYIFGVDLLAGMGTADFVMWAAAFTILMSSLIAMNQDNLKARLAYSTVSQLSYVTLGAMVATSMGVLGGGLQILMHAFGKMTLFMCAGAIYVATKKQHVSELDGLGRTMPITFGAFLVGALSIIGLPPLGGAWSKFYLALGAADAEQLLMIAVLMISSILNVVYLLPIAIRAFYAGGKPATPQRIQEAPFFCVAPPVFTAAGCLVLFFAFPAVVDFLQPILETP
ncbi:MAG: proton-conducting transporter membrane subunit [Pseudomonadota bacterium]